MKSNFDNFKDFTFVKLVFWMDKKIS